MRVLNLLSTGEIGGIECLCRDIGRFSGKQNDFCFLFNTGPIYEYMNANGIITYDLTSIGNKISVKKLSKLIHIAKKYDVITVHHGDPNLKLYFILATKMVSIKDVVYVHSCFEFERFASNNIVKKTIAKKIFQKCFNISNKIIFVSRAGKDSYSKNFLIEEKKSTVIYNGISNEKLIRGKNNCINSNKPYVITYIGRLNKIKGVEYLIRSMPILLAKWNVKLVIVGDGKDKKRLEDISERLQLDTLVFFEGQQIDIDKYLEKSTIFAYPSICQEVFGISLVEAMAYGIPCVGTNVGGIPEVITENCGVLCEPANEKDLASKIDVLLSGIENGGISEMMINEKERAARFSITNTIDQLEKTYRELL